jgi:hypothetical protein
VTEPDAARITWLGSTQHANKVGDSRSGFRRAAERRRRLGLGMFCLPQTCDALNLDVCAHSVAALQGACMPLLARRQVAC